ncbi:MAG: 5-(carboxyamino)imidazole ribonucleotide mutase [Candidatus Omnitrophota bacterium]|nr:MAG: 5-(carboxyamino)imidazole ribonucleotide mutase [Candidatus Omnitrophota bacterium]
MKPDVAIIMGSKSDLPVMSEAEKMLDSFGVKAEIKVLSAHRTPLATINYAVSARQRGIKVIIAGAGGAAHLAGVVAAHTTLPVIGVPMPSRHLKGIDSLFSTVQMPSGVPVATMAIGASGAKNAGILAVQIIALENEKLEKRLVNFKKKLAASIKRKKG